MDIPADANCPQHILNELRDILDGRFRLDSIEPVKSAQQQVWIIHGQSDPAKTDMGSDTGSEVSDLWTDALKYGRNYLVIRLWKGGSRWWNLHQNQNVVELANAEVHGYRLARQAFNQEKARMDAEKVDNGHNDDNNQHETRTVLIPQVLHYHPGTEDSRPWAVFEYVGPRSKRFQTSSLRWDETWMKSMIVSRHEFGFEEPHPRWGRVSIDRALDYALQVLNTVVIPLHQATRQTTTDTTSASVSQHFESENYCTRPIYFQDMIELYAQLMASKIEPYIVAGQDDIDPNIQKMVGSLKGAIERLTRGARHTVQKLHPVLVHMDLQPQNLLFGRDVHTSQMEVSPVCSVLDWEEAALADPRFELLLLGRKVCANQFQAQTLWNTYQDRFPSIDLGPLTPWLELECVHSITTQLLQSFQLLDGGRNPWEAKSDLLGKLDRECQRLDGLQQS